MSVVAMILHFLFVYVCFRGVEELVSRFPQYADIKDDEGNTPLHVASALGHRDIVTLLVNLVGVRCTSTVVTVTLYKSGLISIMPIYSPQ